MLDLNLPETIAAIVLGAAICAFCGWKGAQAAHPRRGVRMTPYRFLMLLSASFTFPCPGAPFEPVGRQHGGAGGR